MTLSDLLSSPEVLDGYPLLTEMAHVFASTGIRNRATVVGNLCSAVPSCDVGPVALVYDAVLHVVGPDGERNVAITDFILGPKTTILDRGEIVTGITLSPPSEDHGTSFVKLARYRGEDLAQASVAVLRSRGPHHPSGVRRSWSDAAPSFTHRGGARRDSRSPTT